MLLKKSFRFQVFPIKASTPLSLTYGKSFGTTLVILIGIEGWFSLFELGLSKPLNNYF
jgi:hypothetical protein